MRERLIRFLPLCLFFALLLWGGVNTLLYLGVPVHSAVLMSGEAQELVKETCGESHDLSVLLCRGAVSFFPFLRHTIGRSSSFILYVLFSIVFALGFLLVRWLRTGKVQGSLLCTPFHFVALFLLLLWFLFTTLSFGSDGTRPVRQIVEPILEVYSQAKGDALGVLRKNFQSLQESGCLSFVGPFGRTEASVYTLRQWCIQRSFLTRVVPPFLFVVVFFLELLCLGRALLHLCRPRPLLPLAEFATSLGLGAAGWISILWTVSVLHLFIAPVGWVLVLGIPLLLYRQVLYWFQRFRSVSLDVALSFSSAGGIFLVWLLISYIALNFLSVIRPFPIGWDDLGSYLNRPRVLVSYGHFIHSMAPFQWEYLTSLGFLLFGYDSTLGTVTSLMVNWSAGLIAVLVIFSSFFLLAGSGGVLAALLYYTLPLVGHFSFADMKVDNAGFFLLSLSILSLLLFLFPRTPHSSPGQTSDVRWIVLAGVFAGFAFAVKQTAVMGIMAFLAVLVGAFVHWSGFFVAVLLVVWLYVFRGVLNMTVAVERVIGHPVSSVAFFAHALLIVGAAGAFFVAWRHRSSVIPFFRIILIFFLSAAFSVLPWVVHNNILRGNVIPRLELGVPNILLPVLDIAGEHPTAEAGQVVRSLPPDLAVDIKNTLCTEPTGSKEELDRYWGFTGGWRHYVTLPWRTVMNIDSAGYYVTTFPILLLFPLLLLLPAFWGASARWMRWVWLGTAFIVLEWMFLANGVPWYGLAAFFGLSLALEFLYRSAPDLPNRFIIGTLFACSILIALSNRFWQLNQMQNLIEYPIGKASAAVMRERTIPFYDDIRDVVLALHSDNPHRPYLYRVGTFIPYFIPRNLEIIASADHQLDLFQCLYQERDPALTLKRLQHLGFNSIIFDTNTATIERDLNGTLHKKVQDFVDFLNNRSLGLQVVVNDLDEGVAFVILP